MIDEILKNNRRFVDGKGYERHITDGKPSGKTLIVTCMDTRLSVMLPEALGIKNGEVKIVKVAGGVIMSWALKRSCSSTTLIAAPGR